MMNGAKYIDMLNQDIIPLLNIARGNIFNRYWWVQDAAPAHRTLIVKERLLEIFHFQDGYTFLGVILYKEPRR